MDDSHETEASDESGDRRRHLIDKEEDVPVIWKVGDVILGTYEVMPLSDSIAYAEGGVGVVHRVYHREWNLDLAVKSPKPGVLKTEVGKLNYERECQTWIELGLHPHIVTCFLVRRIGGIPRLFAELVPDGSLSDWIREGRIYQGGRDQALRKILDIAIQFAWGLEHAHRQGLLHLDVKPANVMMSGSSAKVTDFGLAQATAVATSGGSAESEYGPQKPRWEGMTPSFCSPEQYEAFLNYQRKDGSHRSEQLTAKTDIWSWAISVLAMFHGRSPCRKGGQTAGKVFEIYLKQPPSEVRPSIPAEMVELMRDCFRPLPEDRPESMTEVADRLVGIYQEVTGEDYPRRKPISAVWTPESINNRAASMLDLGKIAEAEKLLAQAWQLQPWHPQTTYNQTLLSWRQGKVTDLDAVQRIESLTKTRHEDWASYYALGLIHRERANPGAALGAFEQSLEAQQTQEACRALQDSKRERERAAACLERYSLPLEDEPFVWLDDTQKQILFRSSSAAMHLRNLLREGDDRNFYPPSDAGSEAALSEDMKWELAPGPDSLEVLLKATGTGKRHATFSLIPWGDGSPAEDEEGGIELVIQDALIQVRDRREGVILGHLAGHEGNVTAVYLSPDGKRALSGGNDRTLRVWDVRNYRCLRTFRGLDSSVNAVYLCRHRRIALSINGGRSLRVWNVAPLCRKKQQPRSPIMVCQVSSSEEVAEQQGQLVQLCENAEKASAEGDFRTAIEQLRAARNLSGWDSMRSRLDLWQLVGRRSIRLRPFDIWCAEVFTEHDQEIQDVAILINGKIAVSAGRDQVLCVWDLLQGKCCRRLTGHYDWVRSVDLSMDKQRIVSGSWDQTVRVWDLESGRCQTVFQERIKSINRVHFAPNGRIVAVADGNGVLSIWEANAGRKLVAWQAHHGYINTIDFSRDGRYVVTGGDDGQVRIWHLDSQQVVREIARPHTSISSAALSTNLRLLAVGASDGSVLVWDLEQNREKQVLQGHLGGVTSVALLSDDRWVVSGSKDRTIRLWSLEDGTLHKTLEGHTEAVRSVAVDLRGETLVSGGDDCSLCCWELTWDYEFPGWREHDPMADLYLREILSVFHDHFRQPSEVSLPDKVVHRILREMEYRGFGWIPEEKIVERIRQLGEKGEGPPVL